MPAQVGRMDAAKRSVKGSQTYCQKQGTVRCNALEPVLEHCEAAPTEKAACRSAPREAWNSESGKRGKPMRMLLKLRDGYVKLMNDLSSGADMSGVSSFYGCPGADYPTLAMATSRVVKEEQERETMIHALQVQLAHSRQFTSAVA